MQVMARAQNTVFLGVEVKETSLELFSVKAVRRKISGPLLARRSAAGSLLADVIHTTTASIARHSASPEKKLGAALLWRRRGLRRSSGLEVPAAAPAASSYAPLKLNDFQYVRAFYTLHIKASDTL